MSPGYILVSDVVEFNATVTMECSAFDPDAYRARLVETLDGLVRTGDVILTVTCGSVHVAAHILAHSHANAIKVRTRLAANLQDSQAAAATLKVPIVDVTEVVLGPPMVVSRFPPPPAAPPPAAPAGGGGGSDAIHQGSQHDRVSFIVGLAVAAGLFFCCLTVSCIYFGCWCSQRSQSRRRRSSLWRSAPRAQVQDGISLTTMSSTHKPAPPQEEPTVTPLDASGITLDGALRRMGSTRERFQRLQE